MFTCIAFAVNNRGSDVRTVGHTPAEGGPLQPPQRGLLDAGFGDGGHGVCLVQLVR